MTVTKRYHPRNVPTECAVKDALDVEEIKEYVDSCYRGVEIELERLAAEPIEGDGMNGFFASSDAFHRSFAGRPLLFLCGVRIPCFTWSRAATRKQKVWAALLYLFLTMLPCLITCIGAGACDRWYEDEYFHALCASDPHEIWSLCSAESLTNPIRACHDYVTECRISRCLAEANNVTGGTLSKGNYPSNNVRKNFPSPPSSGCTDVGSTTWYNNGVSWGLAGGFFLFFWICFVLPAAVYYEPRILAGLFGSSPVARKLLTIGHALFGLDFWHTGIECTRHGWKCNLQSVLHRRISMTHLKYCFAFAFVMLVGFVLLCAYGDLRSVSYSRRPYYPVTALHFGIHVVKFFCVVYVPVIVIATALTTFIRILVLRISMLMAISDLLLKVRDLAVMGDDKLKSMLDDVALARDGLSHLIQQSIYTWSPTVIAGIFVCGTFLIVFILKIIISGPEAAAAEVTWSLGLAFLVLLLLFIMSFVSGADNDFREQLIVLRGKRIRNLTAHDVVDKDGMIQYRTSWREEVDSLIQWMWHRPLAIRVMGVPITQDLVKAVGYVLFTLGSAVAQTLVPKNGD